jgi:hypothetical protein
MKIYKEALLPTKLFEEPTFLADMSDLLPSGLDFKSATAFPLVEEKLIALL